MKILSLCLLLTSATFAFGFSNASLVNDFMRVLDRVLIASDANLQGLECGDNLEEKGIICAVNLELFDADENGGSSEVCTEVSTYNGGSDFNVICSTCHYAKGSKTYAKSCAIQQSEEKDYVANGLLSLLKEDVYFGHIANYKTPLFQHKMITETGSIEIYKLNYSIFIYGGSGQVNSEQDADEILGTEDLCEYIVYSPEDSDYELTGVDCTKPIDEVIEEKLIDEL